MSFISRIFDRKATPLLTVAFVILIFAENRRRLRKRTQPQFKRMATNSLVAVPSFALLRFVLLPLMVKIALKSKEHQLGLNNLLNIPPSMRVMSSFLILDYGNYLWHALNHKVPFLWRFHLVHHTDLDLDTATAFRFHFGELIGSVFFRGLFVLLSGATASEVLIYELFFEGATQFQHTNWKLPYQLEKGLNKIIVTPRMHGIHHSMKREETDSNYSVIFSFWDRLHQTLKFNDNQDSITIGVPAYSDPEELTALNLLTMPFKKIRTWEID